MTSPQSPQAPRSCLALLPLLLLAPVCLTLELLRIAIFGLVLAGVAWAMSAIFDVPLKAALLGALWVWVATGAVWAAYSTWRGVRCPGCGRRIKTERPLRCAGCGGPAALKD